MTVRTLLQPSFAGGELAPSLSARSDLTKYQIGCKKLRNMYVHACGGASNRPGTVFVHEAKDNENVRLISFEFSDDQAYMLEFGAGYIRFYIDGGVILDDAGEIYEVVTDYTEAELPDLKYTQSADVMYIVHPKHAPMTLIRKGHADWELREFVNENGPWMSDVWVEDEEFTYTEDQTGPAKLPKTRMRFQRGQIPKRTDETKSYGNTYVTLKKGTLAELTGDIDSDIYHGSKIKLYTEVQAKTLRGSVSATSYTVYDDDGNATAVTETNTEVIEFQIPKAAGWTLTTNGTWTGYGNLYMSSDNGITWVRYKHFSGEDNYNVSLSEIEDNDSILKMKCSISSGKLNYDLTANAYIRENIGVINYQHDEGCFDVWTLNEWIVPVTEFKFSDVTKGTWYEDYWCIGRYALSAWYKNNYPSAVGFYSDRLVFANSPAEPQTVWYSKVSDYTDFGTSLDLADDDAINITLMSRTVNKVNSMVDLSTEMLLFTGRASWINGPSGDGVMTPSAFRSARYEEVGGAKVDPVLVANRCLFVTESGAEIRDVGYNLENDGYRSDSISIWAEHLFRGYTITDMAYQAYPDSILWCVRSDGKLLGLTYMREQQVLAWHVHETDGFITNIAVLHVEGENQLWLVVKRGENVCIERIMGRLGKYSADDAYFVDSGLYFDGSGDGSKLTGKVSGLAHLEGRQVSILGDGLVLDQQIVTDGGIDLGTVEYSKVAVGLPYTALIETLNLEGGRVGQSNKTRAVSALARFLNSRGGEIGTAVGWDNEPGGWVVLRGAGASVEVPQPADYDEEVILPSGYKEGTRLAIRQTDPLPLTVVAIWPKVEG